MTTDQTDLKLAIQNAHKLVLKAGRDFARLKRSCVAHFLRPLTQDELTDRWMSISATCEICQRYFGWRCKLSPDGVCHYHSQPNDEPNGAPQVDLITGYRGPVPANHNLENESPDSCIWCGMPNERK